MLAKLRIGQGEDFQLKVTTLEVARMLVNYVIAVPHPLCIGSEQGDPEWDDFVVLEKAGCFVHYQVKRQHTPIAPAKVEKCLQAIAKWVDLPAATTGAEKRRFCFALPHDQTSIGDDLNFHHLYELCTTQNNQYSTVAGLLELEKSSPLFKEYLDWLQTKCGFINHDHILRGMYCLSIGCFGNEPDIESRTEELLTRVFNSPSEVREKIQSVISNDYSFTSAVSPRLLLEEVRSFLRADVATWTLYKFTDTSWEITGIHDSVTGRIEDAKQVVQEIWNPTREKRIKFNAPLSEGNCPLPLAILRMAIHLGGLSIAQFTDITGWYQIAASLLGHTLGISEDDLNPSTLNISHDTAPLSPSNTRKIELLASAEIEAEMLNNEMHQQVWEKTCIALREIIRNRCGRELRDELDARRIAWLAAFEGNKDGQREILRTALVPSAEVGKVSSDLRVGLKTAKIIAEGLFFRLIVAAALDDSGQSWELVSENLSIRTIAARYWSGPSNELNRLPRRLEEDGVTSLIGKESAEILILSAVEFGATQIFEESLACDREVDDSMASPNRPSLLVTNTKAFRSILQGGSLASLKRFLKDTLALAESGKATSITKASINESDN